MNEILTLILQVCSTAAAIFAVAGSFLYIRKTKNELLEVAEDFLERGKAFYIAEKTDFAQNLPELAKGVFSPLISGKMSELGQMSGLSRNMKALESDVITDLANQAMPGVGGIAAKYIQKYPFLLPLIQQFAGNMGQGGQPGFSNSNNGGHSFDNPFNRR